MNNMATMETIISAIASGCIFGKLCLQPCKEPRKWLYSSISIDETIIVSLHKTEILRMIENHNRRILNEQMTFMKSIPNPDFNLISRKKLENICQALKTFTCIRGVTIFE